MQSSSDRAASPLPAAPVDPAGSALAIVSLTVDCAELASLRRLTFALCGDRLDFIRVRPCRASTRMRVWFGDAAGWEAALTHAIQRALPLVALASSHRAARRVA